MKKTNKLIPGDVVMRYIYDDGQPVVATDLGPREDGAKGYRWQNSSGLFESGKAGFDRKSTQDWITIILRDGNQYRYHPSDWGPLWK